MQTKRNILTAILAAGFLAAMGALPTATAAFTDCDKVSTLAPIPVGSALVIPGVLTAAKPLDPYYVVLPAVTLTGSPVAKWNARLVVGEPATPATFAAKHMGNAVAGDCITDSQVSPDSTHGGFYLAPNQPVLTPAYGDGFVLTVGQSDLGEQEAIAYSIVLTPCDTSGADEVCGASV